MFNIKFFKAADLERNMKATIHKTGKLGFTAEAANRLHLSICKSVSMGINQDDPTDKNIYFQLHYTEDMGTFKVIKAGNYYYINTKPLFDTLKMDYEKENIVFDISIVEERILIDEIYCLKRRKKEKTNTLTKTQPNGSDSENDLSF